MAARQVLLMVPPVQNRKPRVYRAIEIRANLFTDEELRKRYRFGREGIHYITEMVTLKFENKSSQFRSFVSEGHSSVNM